MHKREHVTPRILCLALALMSVPAFGLFASDSNSTAADTNTPPATNAAKPAAVSNDEVTLLRQQIALQQKQLEQMQKALEDQKRLLDRLTQPAPATQVASQPAKPAESAESAAQPAKPAAAEQTTLAAKSATDATPVAQHSLTTADTQSPDPSHPASLGEVASTTPMIPQSQKKTDNAIVIPAAGTTANTATMSSSAQEGGGETSPLQFHLGAATFTPVGFMDFTSVFRTKAAGGNIGTSFGSIPYATLPSGTYQTNLSELRFSVQNSRIGFRTDADVKGAHVTGYMEADFLGTPSSTNIAVTNNAQLLRVRLYWVDLRKGGWEILGGQTWSLATPGRTGISPLPADVFYTQDMDVNYQAGLFWGRIPELRFVYHLPSDKAAFAFAIDSPDQYVGGSSGGGTITLPTLLGTYASELDEGASSGGIATPDVAPDFIAKLAFDPTKRIHFEIGGMERTFKVWDPGTAAGTDAPAVTAQTFSNEGGAGFFNVNVEVFKGLRLLTNNFWSDGGGRYIFGQAPDLVANANGTITPLHSSSTVTGLEYVNRGQMIYAYYGGIMVGRDSVIDSNGKLVGYGYAGSATSQNRTIQELTFGTNNTIWKHPKYGALNFISQFSYVVRDPWYIAPVTSGPTNPVNATDNMLFFDLRYTLPGSAPTLGKPAR